MLSSHLQPAQLAANLRCVMSGIVSGNIKPEGMELIRKYGPYRLRCEPELEKEVDALLRAFVRDHRMKIPDDEPYVPCYITESSEAQTCAVPDRSS